MYLLAPRGANVLTRPVVFRHFPGPFFFSSPVDLPGSFCIPLLDISLVRSGTVENGGWKTRLRTPTPSPSLSPLENLKLFRFYNTIANFMRWAPGIYLHFHKNLIIPQHSAQLMYFFALLESSYCERRQFSKKRRSPPRRNKNYILGWHNISNDASDADWQKRWITALVVRRSTLSKSA